MLDNGVGRAIFDDINLNMDLSLFLNKKKIEVNVDQVSISISDLHLMLQGGDFSEYLNQFVGQFREFLQEKLQ